VTVAAADYRLCDVCNGKVFYDVELDYRFTSRQDPIEKDEQAMVCGEPQGYRLQYLGDWAVICEQCCKTHRVAILPRADADTKGDS
jgi:hypothetical protein